MKLAPSIDDLTTIAQAICHTDHAVAALVHVLDEYDRRVKPVAHCGLPDKFLAHLENAVADDGTPWSQALIERRRVVIRDAETDPAFRPHRRYTHAVGVRAIQSTPLITDQRHAVGVLTTFYTEPVPPGRDSRELIDECCALATGVIEADRLEHKLQRLMSRSGMPQRPVTDRVARAADAARGLIRALDDTNHRIMVPAARKNLGVVVAELEYQVKRQDV